MNLLRLTAGPSSPGVSAKRPASASARWQSIFGHSGQATRALTAALLAGSAGGGMRLHSRRIRAKAPPASAAEQHPELPTPQSPEQNRPNQDPNAPTQAPRPFMDRGRRIHRFPFHWGVGKYNYQNAPKPFPNLLAPYRAISMPDFNVRNKPRVEQLIHEGKLEITLQDAVELALENNMDIAVREIQPWFGRYRHFGHQRRRQCARHRTARGDYLFDRERPLCAARSAADGNRRICRRVHTDQQPVHFRYRHDIESIGSGLISHSSQYNWQHTAGIHVGHIGDGRVG